MSRGVERTARKVLGEKAGVMRDALTWAGTSWRRSCTMAAAVAGSR